MSVYCCTTINKVISQPIIILQYVLIDNHVELDFYSFSAHMQIGVLVCN